MERDTNNFEQEERHRIEGLVSPELVPFVTSEKTGEFVKGHFAPGPIKVQEGIGGEKTSAPVPIEYQERLLSLLPWVLTQMCVDGTPINPPKEQPVTGNISEMTTGQLSQLKCAYSNTSKPEHITELLRPERLGAPDVQRYMGYLASLEGNRYLLPFGHRIWEKLVRKAMTTTGSAREMIHPIKSLQTYPGLIIGTPDRKPDSYTELMRMTNHVSTRDVIKLMLYEIDNGLAEKKDFEEMRILADGNPQFAESLRKSGSLVVLLTYTPLTMTLIHGPLRLSQEEIANIIAAKEQGMDGLIATVLKYEPYLLALETERGQDWTHLFGEILRGNLSIEPSIQELVQFVEQEGIDVNLGRAEAARRLREVTEADKTLSEKDAIRLLYDSRFVPEQPSKPRTGVTKAPKTKKLPPIPREDIRERAINVLKENVANYMRGVEGEINDRVERHVETPSPEKQPAPEAIPFGKFDLAAWEPGKNVVVIRPIKKNQ